MKLSSEISSDQPELSTNLTKGKESAIPAQSWKASVGTEKATIPGLALLALPTHNAPAPGAIEAGINSSHEPRDPVLASEPTDQPAEPGVDTSRPKGGTKASFRERLKTRLKRRRTAPNEEQKRAAPHVSDVEEVLQAYSLENGPVESWRKLPFSRPQITSALSDALKLSRGSVWNQYLSLDVNSRQAVDNLTSEVNCSRPWTLIGISLQPHSENPVIISVVFYALGFPVEPVRVKFKGQQIDLPYETCLTWEVSMIEVNKRGIPSSQNDDRELCTSSSRGFTAYRASRQKYDEASFG